MSNLKQNEPLQLTDDVVKYYDDLIKTIKKDFANKKYQEAIDRCNEELEQPYIPFEYLQEFEKLLHQLQIEYRYLSIDEEIKKMPKNKMIYQIFDGTKFDVYLFDYWLEQFHNEVAESDFRLIASWFLDKNIDNHQKIYILDALAHFNINKDFVYLNSRTENEITLNTMNFHEHSDFNKYNETLSIIEQQVFQDPVVAKFASELLNACAHEYFPDFFFSSAQELADIILKIIYSSLNFTTLDINDMDDTTRKVYQIFLQTQNID